MSKPTMRLRPSRCGPAAGWPLQSMHEEREVEVSVFDAGLFDLRLVLREADYPGESRDDLAKKAVLLGEAIGPALLAALRAEGVVSR